MTGTIEALFFAAVIFVGGHFALGFPPVRAALVEKTGEHGFKGLFALISGISFIWMLMAYGAAPSVEIWSGIAWGNWVPNLVLPVSAILLVCGYTTANPTAVGQERSLREDPRPARGIITVTRHPALWAIGLWALSHLVVSGDAAGVLLFGGLAVLGFGGMAGIDAKKRAMLGAAWGPFALTTSAIPFLAIAQGRATVDWSGIGWLRIAGGLALWAGFWLGHPYFAGVSPAIP